MVINFPTNNLYDEYRYYITLKYLETMSGVTSYVPQSYGYALKYLQDMLFIPQIRITINIAHIPDIIKWLWILENSPSLPEDPVFGTPDKS